MNCFLCFRETGDVTRAALGICHLCGAGCCEGHLVAIISRPVAGMAGIIPQKRQLRCLLCYEEVISGPRPRALRLQRKAHPGQSPVAWWKKWLTRHRQQALPSAGEAVALVERFLKHDQRQEKRDG